MSTRTVRITERTHSELVQLASQFNESMQTLMEQAVEDYKRKLFFEQANIAYSNLRDDPVAWRQAQAERELWENNTIADGLDEE
ncbi:MAG TPA: toxin-antitoxin system protein [Blastocatellia bacterium]|nr:toxin-antitoxin system protein [Blastocatellia bacterium]